MERDEFYKKATEFLLRKSESHVASIAPGEHLVESGIADSLLMTELIVYVESLRKAPIEIDNFDVETFVTLERIYDHYIAKTPAAKEG